MRRRLLSALGALVIGTGTAQADCGPPPASDAALLAEPAAAAAIATARATVPNAEGRLWRVETTPPSYLIGTFHVAAGGIERPGATLERIVDGARLLFVEVDQAALDATLTAWARDPAKLFRSDGARLSAAMTAAEKAKAEAVLQRYGVPFAVADQMRPFILFGLLSLPPCAVAAAGKDGLDAVLEARAVAAGIPVRPLETVDEQLAVLGDDDPDEVDAILRMLLSQAGSLEADWFVNLALYRQGKTAALWVYGIAGFADLVGEREAERIASMFWERLVATRNRRMVERMLPRLREGGVVVAVGALHLPGEDGIVALLRDAGLAVVPVAEDAAAGGAGEAGPAAKVVERLPAE